MNEEPFSLDLAALWRKRYQNVIAEAVRYLMLVANSGLLFTALFLLIIGLYYYDNFLAWLPAQIPVRLLIALFFAWLLTRGAYRTFLQEADLVFLTPVESAMPTYFLKCLRYNLLLQWLALLVLLVTIYPLYQTAVASGFLHFALFGLIVLVLKGWNLTSGWQALRMRNEGQRLKHTIFRFFFNFLFLFWFLMQAPVWFLVPLALLACLFFLWDEKTRREHGIDWYRILEMEARLSARFYHFVGFFVDVPQSRTRVKRRKGLSQLTRWLAFQPANTYRYVFLKMFFRSQETFGIYIRLMLIGGLAVYFIPDFYGKLAAYVVFLYLTGIQLGNFWTYFQDQYWFHFYPEPRQHAANIFRNLTWILLISESVVMWIPLVIGAKISVLSLIFFPIAALAVSTFYCYGPLRRKQQSEPVFSA